MCNPPPSSSTTNKKRQSQREKKLKDVHVTALDGVVNVNSLFTIAIFLGLAMASPGQLKSLNVREECQPRANTAKMLPNSSDQASSAAVDETLLTAGVLFSAMSSVVGCLFLLVSMVNVIELKLGVLSCMATSTIVSVAFLIPLSLAGILIYVFAAINRKGHYHTKKNVHVTALDSVVDVNSLFTIAMFLGLDNELVSPGELQSLNVREECQPGANTAKMLIVFEIISFSFYLFSSLVAQSIKLSLDLQPPDQAAGKDGSEESLWLTTGVLFSAMSSMLGCLFMLVSVVYVVELRLGVLSCMAASTIVSVAFLIPLSLTGIIIYVFVSISVYVSRASGPDAGGGQQEA
nr:uncharacterized protein LOC109162586 [Ipomoea batatas]